MSDDDGSIVVPVDLRPIPELKRAILEALRRQFPTSDTNLGEATNACFTLVAEAAALWHQLHLGPHAESAIYTFDNFAAMAREAIESHAKVTAS